MTARIWPFFAPPRLKDEDETRKAALLNLILLTIWGINLLYLLVSAVVGKHYQLQLILIALLCIGFVGLRHLLRRGSIRLVSIIIVGFLWVSTTFSALVFGGIHAHPFNTYIVCIFISGLLLGGRWGVGLAGLSTLAGLGMLWADAKGLLLADDIAHIPLLIWWSEALAFTIAALLLHVTTASLKNALTHVRQSEQALFVKNQELQLRTQELEQQGLALHQSQAFLQAILSSLPAQIAVLDKDGVILSVNHAWEQFADENGGDLSIRRGVGLNFLTVCRRSMANGDDPNDTHSQMADAQMALAGLEAVLSGTQSSFTFECPCHSPQQERWFMLYGIPLAAAQGGAVISYIEITKRKHAEAALRQSEERYRQLVELSPYPIMINRQNQIAYANAACLQLFRATDPQQLLGKAILDFVHPDYRALVEQRIETYLRQGLPTPQVEERVIRLDGTVVDAEVVSAPIHDENELAYLVIARDITQRKQDEAQKAQLLNEIEQQRSQLRELNRRLAETQENERKELARELHDRIGQDLTALGIHLALILKQLPPHMAEVHVISARLDDAITEVAQITEQIRDVMADLHPPMLDDYGLFTTLQWYTGLMIKRTGLAIIVQGAEPVPRLSEPIALALFRVTQEALTNVIKHAQATHVTITLLTEDGLTRLVIADNGRGIDPPSPEETAFTQSWGLLAMRERIEAVKGRYWVKSAPGQGTKIIIEMANASS